MLHNLLWCLGTFGWVNEDVHERKTVAARGVMHGYVHSFIHSTYLLSIGGWNYNNVVSKSLCC